MVIKIEIEKSFEGEFRCVVYNGESICSILTMPWADGESEAVKQLGKILNRASTDVLFALENDAPCKSDFIKQILDRPY